MELVVYTTYLLDTAISDFFFCTNGAILCPGGDSCHEKFSTVSGEGKGQDKAIICKSLSHFSRQNIF